MSVRLAILKPPVRLAVAAGLCVLSAALPLFVILWAVTTLPGLMTQRSALQSDVAGLETSVAQPVLASTARGAPVAGTVRVADRALTRQADFITDALLQAGAQIERRADIRDATFAGVSERRLLLEVRGEYSALAFALSELAALEPVGIQFMQIRALDDQSASLTLVLVQVLEQGAPS